MSSLLFEGKFRCGYVHNSIVYSLSVTLDFWGWMLFEDLYLKFLTKIDHQKIQQNGTYMKHPPLERKRKHRDVKQIRIHNYSTPFPLKQ